MELNQENFTDFIDRLQHHHRGEGVEDHCTANPIFIVQSLKRIGGIDLDYDPPHYWTDSDSELELTDEELMTELALFTDEGGVYDDFAIAHDKEVLSGEHTLYEKIGYHESWEYVCAHLTREAAEAFIKRKSHDHKKLRIYVDSQYWAWEFNAIVDGLLSGKIGLIEPTQEVSNEALGEEIAGL